VQDWSNWEPDVWLFGAPSWVRTGRRDTRNRPKTRAGAPLGVADASGKRSTDPVIIESTNFWPWLGLAPCAPNWANWTRLHRRLQLFHQLRPQERYLRRAETNAP
jgi:hypothetical protein